MADEVACSGHGGVRKKTGLIDGGGAPMMEAAVQVVGDQPGGLLSMEMAFDGFGMAGGALLRSIYTTSA